MVTNGFTDSFAPWKLQMKQLNDLWTQYMLNFSLLLHIFSKLLSNAANSYITQGWYVWSLEYNGPSFSLEM